MVPFSHDDAIDTISEIPILMYAAKYIEVPLSKLRCAADDESYRAVDDHLRNRVPLLGHTSYS